MIWPATRHTYRRSLRPLWRYTATGMFVPLLYMFSGVPSAMAGLAQERTRREALLKTAANLHLDPEQLLNPRAWQERATQKALETRSKALAAIKNRELPKWYSDETASIARQQAVHTLGGLSQDLSDGRPLDEKRQPELVRKLIGELGRLSRSKPAIPLRGPVIDRMRATTPGLRVRTPKAWESLDLEHKVSLPGKSAKQPSPTLLRMAAGAPIAQQVVAVSAPPASDDLAPTEEAQASDPLIVTKAQALGNDPVRIFNFVHDSIATEVYYGSKKGAIGTLREGAGNDYDQASLLIALLRASGVPARYHIGNVALTPDQAGSFTGGETLSVSAGLLAGAGVPSGIQSLGTGRGMGLAVEHVWVDAFVAATAYRGIPTPGAVNSWVPLSPSLKVARVQPTVDLRAATTFDFDAYLATVTPKRPLDVFEDQLRRFISSNGIDCTSLDRAERRREIVSEALPHLPADLPAPRLSSLGVLSRLPESSKHMVTIVGLSSGGQQQFSYTASMSSLWGRRISVFHEPATQSDTDIIASYGGLEQTPAYLVNLRPKLRIDDTTVALGSPAHPGTRQSLRMDMQSPSLGLTRAEHRITVGDVSAYVLDPGLVPETLIGERKGRFVNLAGDDLEAEKLYVTALTIFREIGLARRRVSRLHWIATYKEIEEGQARVAPRVTEFQGTPVSISRDFFVIDVPIVRYGSIAVDGNNTRSVNADKIIGFDGSFLEHRMSEIFRGARAYSAVKLLQIANQNGTRVLTFDQSNAAAALAQLQWPADLRSRLSDIANQGFVVQAPVVAINDIALGPMFGAIAVDPISGAGFYLINQDNAVLNGGVGQNSTPQGAAPGCASCGEAAPVGSSAHLYSGNYFETFTDLTLPARGLPLMFERTYGSQLGWTHNYRIRLELLASGDLDFVDHSGVHWLFKQTGSGIWQPPPKMFQTIHATAPGFVMSFKDGTTYAFNANGSLSYEEDSNGHRISMAYSSGRLTSVTAAGGAGLVIDYDSNGFISVVTDTAGRRVSFVNDAGGHILSETDVLGHQRIFEYDTLGRMRAKTDFRGNRELLDYDDLNRVVRVQAPEGRVKHLAYDVRNRRTVITDAVGNNWLFELSDLGQPVRKVDPLGNEEVMVHDARGNVIAERDARGHNTTMTYDSSGNLLSRRDPLGAVTTYSYGALSRLTTTTDADQNTTTNSYDAAGNLVTTTDARGKTTIYSYVDGLPTSITRPGGSTTAMAYDAAGNVTSIADPENGQTRLEYDLAGHLVSMTDPNNRRRTLAVDAKGRMITLTDPMLGQTSFEYDDDGNRTSTTDAANKKTLFAYDGLSRLVATTDAIGNVTRQSFDGEGRVVARWDARGAKTSMTYDAIGRPTSTTDASGATTVMEYCADLAQQPCQMIDALGNRTSIVEDELGREVQRTDPVGNRITTSFDLLGRRVAATDSASQSTRFSYDELGRLTDVVDAAQGRTSYAYDDRGNRLSVTDANGKTTQFGYDRANRLVTELTPINTLTAFRYDAAGNRVEKLDGKGQRTGFAYDPSRRLTDVTYDGAVVPAHFTYDLRGNRTSEGNGDSHRTMTYDELNRVASVFDQETGRTISYTYDANGNRSSMRVMPDDELTQYTWDSRNLLVRMIDPEGGKYLFGYDKIGRRTSASYPNGMTLSINYDPASRVTAMIYLDKQGVIIESFGYTYDSRGNRTSKIFADGGAEVYSYDVLSRLIGVTYPSGRSVTYKYDGVGNRLEMQEGTGALTPAGCTGDQDCDGFPDAVDNCPSVSNPKQEDNDHGLLSGAAAAYRFNEVNGPAVQDLTGRNPGVISEGAADAYPIQRDKGLFGGALGFRVGPIYATTESQKFNVHVPPSPSLDLAGHALTLAMWVKPSATFAGGDLLGKANTVSWNISQSGAMFYQDSAGFTGSPDGHFPLGEWNHLAVTYDGKVLKFYKNGYLDSQLERSGEILDRGAPLYFGCAPYFNVTEDTCARTTFDGLMDEVGIWKRALSDEEIATLAHYPLQGDGAGDACDVCPQSDRPTCRPQTCLDRDGDGYGVQGASACAAGSDRFDCNDGDKSANPGVQEACNGKDDDCDGVVDEGCLQNATRTVYSYNAFNQLLTAGAPRVCVGDADCDGLPDAQDNCPQVANPSQADADGGAKAAGPIAAYLFEESGGTVAQDETGSFPGNILNGATRVAGPYGQALQFDGVDDQIDVPNLSLPDGPLSLEARVKVGAYETLATTIADFKSVFLRTVWDVSGLTQRLTPPGVTAVVPPTQTWTHLAYTWDGTTGRMYVDGEEKSTSTQPPGSAGYKAVIGGDFFTFNGLMDDFAVFGRPLTPTEVQRHASRGLQAGLLTGEGGDACDPCPNNPDPACVPSTCTDADGDGYGIPGASACRAGQPTRFDCNEANASVNPGVTFDVCDNKDNDCDGQVDEDCASAETFTYDLNGNQTSNSEGTGTTTYLWDSRDRLTQVSTASGAVAKYGYDTQNLRVLMDDADGQRRILLDGIEEHGEYSVLGTGERVARYDHDPTRVDALVAQVKGAGVMEQKAHPWVDALGSVYGMGDASGGTAGVVARYAYDVYGVRSADAELSATPWGFWGRRHDPVDVIYVRARQARKGFWLQADPLGASAGVNRFNFANQSPAVFVDPEGMQSVFPEIAECADVYRQRLQSGWIEAITSLHIEGSQAFGYVGRSLSAGGGANDHQLFDYEMRQVFMLSLFARKQIRVGPVGGGFRASTAAFKDASGEGSRITVRPDVVLSAELSSILLHELVHVAKNSAQWKDGSFLVTIPAQFPLPDNAALGGCENLNAPICRPNPGSIRFTLEEAAAQIVAARDGFNPNFVDPQR